MRIRVKVKHIVYGLIVAGLSIYLVIAIALPRIELSAARQQFEAGAPMSKERILAAIHHPVSIKSKWELIREYLIESEYGDSMKRYDVYIGPGVSTVHGIEMAARLTFTWSEKLEILREFVADAPTDGYTARAAKQLASYYYGEGQIDEAVEVLVQMEGRLVGAGNRWQRNDVMMRHASLLFDHGLDMEAARKLDELKGDTEVTNFDMYGRIALIEAEMLIRSGGIDEAIKLVEQALTEYMRQWKEQKEPFGGEVSATDTSMQLESLRAQLQQAEARDVNQSSEVSGVVRRSDGTPVPYAGVFLRHEHAVNHSVTASEPYQMITDDHGRYTFNGVLPGSYQLFLGLDLDQISGYTWPVTNDEWLDIGKGEVNIQDITLHPLMEVKSPVNEVVITESSFEFEWSEVEGAAYYNVNIGLQIENGSVGSLLQSSVPDTRLSILAEQLYDKTTGTSYMEVDGQSVADPLTLLAFANPENRFYWNVEAYDNTGNMITRSNGYRLSDDAVGNLPFFYLKERTLTQADRILLNGEHEQALTAYRSSYDGNPSDIHSLRMMIRLLQEEEGRIPYLREMVALNPTDDYVFGLAHAYYRQENWQAFIDLLASYELGEAHYSYLQSILGTVLLKLGRYQEASALFEQVMDSDPSHRFVGHYIAVVSYLDMNLEEAMDIARRYPDRFMTGNGQDWLLLLQQVRAERERTSQPEVYMDELKQKLGWFFEGEIKQLEQWIAVTEQVSMKKLIQAIIDVN